MSKSDLIKLKEVLDILKPLFIEDFSFVVVDREKILAHNPGRINANVKEGDLIPENWTIIKAMNIKKQIIDEVDSSVIGVPYIGIATPIYAKKSNKVIGGVTIAKPIEKKEQLLKVSQNLLSYTEFFVDSLDDISDESEQFAITGDNLNNIAIKTTEKLKNIENVVNLVKQISEDINLLGFNAMIEAARAGNNGRGFTVVANEIKDLSDNTTSSIKEIEKKFIEINETVNKLNSMSATIKNTNISQAKKLANLNEKVNKLFDLGQEILKVTENLSVKH